MSRHQRGRWQSGCFGRCRARPGTMVGRSRQQVPEFSLARDGRHVPRPSGRRRPETSSDVTKGTSAHLRACAGSRRQNLIRTRSARGHDGETPRNYERRTGEDMKQAISAVACACLLSLTASEAQAQSLPAALRLPPSQPAQALYMEPRTPVSFPRSAADFSVVELLPFSHDDAFINLDLQRAHHREQ